MTKSKKTSKTRQKFDFWIEPQELSEDNEFAERQPNLNSNI